MAGVEMIENIESLMRRGVTDINIRREENICKKWDEQGWRICAIHNFRRQSYPESSPGTANMHYTWYKADVCGYGKNIDEAFQSLIDFLDKMDSYTPESKLLPLLFRSVVVGK